MEAKQKLITQQEEEITVLKRRNSYKRLQSDLMDETMRKAIIESERHELNKEIQDAEFKTQCAEEDLAKFKKSYDALRIDNEMLIQNCKILTKQKRELEFNLRSLEEDFAEMKAELQILKRIQEQQTPDDVMPRKRGEKKKGFLPSELKNRLRDKKEVKQRDSDMSQVCENQ